MKKLYRAVLICLIFPILFNISVNAQQAAKIDTITYAFLPALAFNSDLGLTGGGLFSRYHYKEGMRPFYSYLDTDALISTKGLISASILYDKPQVFDSKLRITTETYISRFLQNQYYGIANYEKLADEPEEMPDYYLFKSFSAGIEMIFRRPIFASSQNHQLDILGMIIFDYKTPFGNEMDRLIAQDQPLGYNGARTSAIGTGLIWEGRNNEFAPTTGTYLNASAEVGQNWTGSSYNYLSFKTDARAYTSFFLVREITFANRLLFQHTSGEIPYWKRAELGGEETMRGYPENRFLDDNALSLNTELRTWLFDFPASDFRLGGTLFIDIGRTFDNQTSLDNVFKDLKYTFGFGGTSSFFTNNFILRSDIGFSDEGYGIYFTAGYMF